jgi:hypothetical protein
MKMVQDMTVKEIEDKYAAAIMRLRGKVVEAENDEGSKIQCWEYEGKLFDYDKNHMKGYYVKRSWTWLLILSGAVSIWLAHYLITK